MKHQVIAAALAGTVWAGALAAELTIDVHGVRWGDGRVYLAVHGPATQDTFPSGEALVEGLRAPAKAGTMRFVGQQDLAPGRYALSAFHEVGVSREHRAPQGGKTLALALLGDAHGIERAGGEITIDGRAHEGAHRAGRHGLDRLSHIGAAPVARIARFRRKVPRGYLVGVDREPAEDERDSKMAAELLFELQVVHTSSATPQCSGCRGIARRITAKPASPVRAAMRALMTIHSMNGLRGAEQALGDMERVVSLIKSLNIVACAPTFTDVHVISTAMADRRVEVLGPARGIGARVTIGVQSLAGNHCYESWIEVEIR